jgi:hypothetical protein
MKKRLTIFLSLLCVAYLQTALACSCADQSGFVEYVQARDPHAVLEIEIVANHTNSASAKVLKVFSGGNQIGDTVEVWDFKYSEMDMCAVSFSIRNTTIGTRLIVSIQLKSTKFYPFKYPYDVEGQYYIPAEPCYNSTLLTVSNDTVRGGIFGTAYGFPRPSNMVYKLPYGEFMTKMSTILSVDGAVSEAEEVSVSPNPATTHFSLGQSLAGKNVTMMNGTSQWNLQVNMEGVVDVSQLSSGMYVLECTLPERKIRKKFLKE